MLSTDRIEIHQSQPLVWPSDLLYVMLAGCDWWISIRSVDNMHDWRKFWKRFRGCFVFESRVSTKTVVNSPVILFRPCYISLLNKCYIGWDWGIPPTCPLTILTCNVKSNFDEEYWELGLIWLQSRQGVEQGLSRATSSTQGFLLLVRRNERDEKGRTLKTRLWQGLYEAVHALSVR